MSGPEGKGGPRGEGRVEPRQADPKGMGSRQAARRRKGQGQRGRWGRREKGVGARAGEGGCGDRR